MKFIAVFAFVLLAGCAKPYANFYHPSATVTTAMKAYKQWKVVLAYREFPATALRHSPPWLTTVRSWTVERPTTERLEPEPRTPMYPDALPVWVNFEDEELDIGGGPPTSEIRRQG